jgi:hypothetical protein
MAKIKEVKHVDEDTGKVFHHQFLYWCEGCGYEHAFALRSECGHHDFNGDLNNPTVIPSLVENYPGRRCHSYIKNGKIQYLTDCNHTLAGQTIELPDIDAIYEARKKK